MHRDPAKLHKTVLDSLAEAVFAVDHDRRIIYFNRTAEKVTGLARNDALGRKCWEVFQSNLCVAGCPLSDTLRTGTPHRDREAIITTRGGAKKTIRLSTALLQDATGKIFGGVESFKNQSMTEEKPRSPVVEGKGPKILTKHHKLLHLLDIMPHVAASKKPVVVTGESGTGKELMARVIHGKSDRASGPFVVVNCGTLQEQLLEQELFGRETTSSESPSEAVREGRVARAQGGTLFLDEVGDAPASIQAKLLELIQSGRHCPVFGAEAESANCRIIASSSTPLAELVSNDQVRGDLAALFGTELALPPLRDRTSDIPLIAQHFIEVFNGAYEKKVSRINNAALRILMLYRYRNNIRELRSIVEHAVIVCPGRTIKPEHLPEYIEILLAQQRDESKPSMTRADFERNRIVSALEQADYSRRRAAEILGMHVTTLWRKMKKLGIE
jgi:PAS domain S-box-containing protein